MADIFTSLKHNAKLLHPELMSIFTNEIKLLCAFFFFLVHKRASPTSFSEFKSEEHGGGEI